MAKLSKKLPKRVTNEKAKAKRARSQAKSEQAKIARVMIQQQRERENANRGYTGKQLDNAIRRYAKLDKTLTYRALKSFVDNNKSTELHVASEMGLI